MKRQRRKTLRVTLSNPGTSPVTALISRPESPFTVRPVGSVEVAGGGRTELSVTFAPRRKGSAGGSFSVSAGGSSPITVSLTGKGK